MRTPSDGGRCCYRSGAMARHTRILQSMRLARKNCSRTSQEFWPSIPVPASYGQVTWMFIMGSHALRGSLRCLMDRPSLRFGHSLPRPWPEANNTYHRLFWAVGKILGVISLRRQADRVPARAPPGVGHERLQKWSGRNTGGGTLGRVPARSLNVPPRKPGKLADEPCSRHSSRWLFVYEYTRMRPSCYIEKGGALERPPPWCSSSKRKRIGQHLTFESVKGALQFAMQVL